MALLNCTNMMHELINLDRQSLTTDSTRELDDFKLIRIPIGTFGGTVERVFVVRDGKVHAFDTGDQGGGQS